MTNQACKIPNIVDEVYKQNWNQKYLVFSLCFSNFDGGYFSIGGYNRKLHKKNEKTNIISYNRWGETENYNVDIDSIWVRIFINNIIINF